MSKMSRAKKDALIESGSAKMFHPRLHNVKGGIKFNAYGKHWTTGVVTKKQTVENVGEYPVCVICGDVMQEEAEYYYCPSCENIIEFSDIESEYMEL